MSRSAVALALLLLVLALEASAQDVLARAQASMAAGQFDQARNDLRSHLQGNPDDRAALAALIQLEIAAERPRTARELADEALSRAPHDSRFIEARRHAIDAVEALRPWTLSLGYDDQRFTDHRIGWREASAALRRMTAAGPVMLRAAGAERYGLRDSQLELALSPRLRQGTYLHAAYGAAPDHQLYPQHRLALDLSQAVAGGVEVSGGFRRLQFDVPVVIYTGTLTKYAGNWVASARLMYAPDRTDDAAKTVQGSLHRYFGGEGRSFAGVRYSHGFPGEEIRNVNDAEVVRGDTVTLDVSATLRRLVLTLAAGRSNQQRAGIPVGLHQNILSASLGVRF